MCVCTAERPGAGEEGDRMERVDRSEDPRRQPVEEVRRSVCQLTDMTGRPGDQTMVMSGGSTATYLARTPCLP